MAADLEVHAAADTVTPSSHDPGPPARRRRGFAVAAGSLAVGMMLLVLYPLGTAWIEAFTGEGGIAGAFRLAAEEPNIGRVLLNTVVVVLVSVVLAGVVGCTFAWLSERTDASLGWISRTLPILPMLIPPIAGAAGWVVLGAPAAGYLNSAIRGVLGLVGIELQRGPLTIHSWYGLVFVYVLYLVPLVFLQVAAALRNVDPSLEEASRSSGASPLRTLRDVTIPSVKPAVGAGGLLAIIYAFALFSVPVVIGYPGGIEVLSVRIVNLMRSFPVQLTTAVTLGLIMMAVIGSGLWLQRRLLRSNRFATISGRSARPTPIPLGRWKWPARILMIGYVLSTAVAPLVGLILVSVQPFWSGRINWGAMSLDRYFTLFSGAQTARQALINSVMLATVGATVAMIIAAIVAAYAARGGNSLIGRGADFATKLPGTVSNILIGVAFIAAFAGPPLRIGGTLLILFLAYIVITMPQASFSASAAYAQVGRDLEEASLSSGATQGRTFRRIVLPLMVPGLAAGWAQVLVLMAGDITASAMLAGPGNPVVGAFMLDEVNFGSYGSLTTIAVALILVSSVVVFTFLWLSRRIGLGQAHNG